MSDQPFLGRDKASFWAWFIQRITAVLIFPLLFIHMIWNHFIGHDGSIDLGFVEANVRNMGFMLIDGGLLVIGLFHGLNGLRNVLYDYVNSLKVRQALNWVFIILGGGFFIYGLWVLIEIF